MTEPFETQNLPRQILDVILGIPKPLIPATIKALDRLVGASVGVAVAWLNQKAARIEAQTESYKAVEASIGRAAASEAGANPEFVKRAANVLVSKAYRKQINREAVAVAAVEVLQGSETLGAAANPGGDVDEDWLNKFERYAEDASSERMQKLWGRVLAGEIRRPGQFSLRTLRFLSEVSQPEAIAFEKFCASAFGGVAPKKLLQPEHDTDIGDLIILEAIGLIQGASVGFECVLNFNEKGHFFLTEGHFVIIFHGRPNTRFDVFAIALTPLGRELLGILPARDARAASKAVALAMRAPQLEEAYLGVIAGPAGRIEQVEVLWQKEGAETTNPQE